MLEIIYGENRRLIASEVLGQLARHQAESPYSRGFLLVPEQQKAGLERRYFTADQSRSLMLEEVLSFRRFALRIAEISGGTAQNTLNPALQSFILGRLTEAHKDELEAFGGAMFRPSFLRLLSDSIGDFLRYEINPQDLDEAALRAEEDGLLRLAARLHDMSLLLAAYEEKFRAMGALPGDLLLKDLAERLSVLQQKAKAADGNFEALDFPWRNYAFLRRSTVWIHGFGISRSLTPQEYRIMALLEKLCKKVVITAECERIPENRREVGKGAPSFRPGRELLYRLSLDYPQASYRKLEGKTPEPAYYIQNFKKPYDELRWTAGEIKRLLFEEEVKPQQIGIALSKPELSADMQQALKALDLPYYTTDTLRTVYGAFSRFNQALIMLLRYGFSREYVLPFLRSPYSGLAPDEADLLDNFMLSRGLEYEKIWDDSRYEAFWRVPALNQGQDPEEEEAAEEEEEAFSEEERALREKTAAAALRLRDQALTDVKQLYDYTRRQRSAREFSLALLDFFERSRTESKLEALQAELLDKNMRDEAEYESKSWNLALDLLAAFAGCKEDGRLPIDDFLYYYEEAFALGGKRRIPAGGNQIILGSLNQLAQEDCDYIFILGAKADSLPGKGFGSGLFHAPDRERISSYLAKSFPDTAEQRIYADASHLYSLLRLPEKEVYISFAGQEAELSPLILTLAKRRELRLLPHPEPFSLRDPLLAEISRAYAYQRGKQEDGRLSSDEDGAALERYLASDEKRRSLLQLAEAPAREMTLSGKLIIPSALSTAMTGRESTWSISRLERYAACPFSFFARYILGLEPREIWRPEAAAYGTLLHKVLELSQESWQDDLRAASSAEERAEIIQTLKAEVGRASVEDLFAQALQSDPGLALFWEEGEAFGVRYKAMKAAYESERMLFSELSAGKTAWNPVSAEWIFGPEVNKPFIYTLPGGGSIRFRGRIDRVDMAAGDETGRSARMIDYKTGSKRVSYDDLYHGLDLQLPIYLEAFEALSPEGVLATDAAYAPLNASVFRNDIPKDMTAAEIEKEEQKALALSSIDLDYPLLKVLRKRSLQLAGDYAGRIRSGDFSAEPRSTGPQAPCRYCDYKTLCAESRGEIAYKKLPGVKELVVRKGLAEKAAFRLKDNMNILLEAEASEGEEDE